MLARVADEVADDDDTDDAPVQPLCVLNESAQTRDLKLCTDVGMTWALGRVRDRLLWPWLELIALATFGAWVFGVALFGWSKPWWTNEASQAERGDLPDALDSRSA